MTLAVALDILVALLLVAAIVAAVMLNRRFAAFRATRAEFEQVIERFNLAAARAEAGVNGLKANAEATGASLQQAIVKAQALRTDLALLIERAEASSASLSVVARIGAAADTPRSRASATSRPPAAAGGDADLLRSLSSLR
jgi:hypothetical protein